MELNKDFIFNIFSLIFDFEIVPTGGVAAYTLSRHGVHIGR